MVLNLVHYTEIQQFESYQFNDLVLDIIARKTALNNVLLLIGNSMEIDFMIECNF